MSPSVEQLLTLEDLSKISQGLDEKALSDIYHAIPDGTVFVLSKKGAKMLNDLNKPGNVPNPYYTEGVEWIFSKRDFPRLYSNPSTGKLLITLIAYGSRESEKEKKTFDTDVDLFSEIRLPQEVKPSPAK